MPLGTPARARPTYFTHGARAKQVLRGNPLAHWSVHILRAVIPALNVIQCQNMSIQNSRSELLSQRTNFCCLTMHGDEEGHLVNYRRATCFPNSSPSYITLDPCWKLKQINKSMGNHIYSV